MFIITLEGREEEGAYSFTNDDGEQILYMFEEEDDATRFALMLEDKDYPKIHVMEVEDDMIIKACNVHGYEYVIFTANDIVIPPDEKKKNDFI